MLTGARAVTVVKAAKALRCSSRGRWRTHRCKQSPRPAHDAEDHDPRTGVRRDAVRVDQRRSHEGDVNAVEVKSLTRSCERHVGRNTQAWLRVKGVSRACGLVTKAQQGSCARDSCCLHGARSWLTGMCWAGGMQGPLQTFLTRQQQTTRHLGKSSCLRWLDWRLVMGVDTQAANRHPGSHDARRRIGLRARRCIINLVSVLRQLSIGR